MMTEMSALSKKQTESTKRFVQFQVSKKFVNKKNYRKANCNCRNAWQPQNK